MFSTRIDENRIKLVEPLDVEHWSDPKKEYLRYKFIIPMESQALANENGIYVLYHLKFSKPLTRFWKFINHEIVSIWTYQTWQRDKSLVKKYNDLGY